MGLQELHDDSRVDNAPTDETTQIAISPLAVEASQ